MTSKSQLLRHVNAILSQDKEKIKSRQEISDLILVKLRTIPYKPATENGKTFKSHPLQ